MISDADQHIFETATMWRDYSDPAKRDLALTIEEDELGYPWVVSPALGIRIFDAYIPTPQDDFAALGGPRHRRLKGLPSEIDFERDLPLDYYDARARVAKLDVFGIDKALQTPNYAIVWGRKVQHRTDILQANMEAWNRRAAELQADGGGRLLVAGHVTMRGDDPDWLDDQLAFLERSGIRTTFLSYGLVDGRRLSHPDHDRAWASFVEHGVVPVFHIIDNEQHPSNFPEEWFEGDDPFTAAAEYPFCYFGIQLALADLVMRGVFEKHPGLKILVTEQQANWLPAMARGLEMSYDAQYRQLGRHVCDLELRPTEYLQRQVRFAAHWAADDILSLRDLFGDIFMFGGDYPHCEGLVSPYEDYRHAVGNLAPDVERALYGETMDAFLN